MDEIERLEYLTDRGCDCHLGAPCSYCEALTEDEVNVRAHLTEPAFDRYLEDKRLLAELGRTGGMAAQEVAIMDAAADMLAGICPIGMQVRRDRDRNLYLEGLDDDWEIACSWTNLPSGHVELIAGPKHFGIRPTMLHTPEEARLQVLLAVRAIRQSALILPTSPGEWLGRHAADSKDAMEIVVIDENVGASVKLPDGSYLSAAQYVWAAPVRQLDARLRRLAGLWVQDPQRASCAHELSEALDKALGELGPR